MWPTPHPGERTGLQGPEGGNRGWSDGRESSRNAKLNISPLVTALSLAEFISFSWMWLLGKAGEGEADSIEFCSHPEIQYLSFGQRNQQIANKCW